ncbi:hypothetical protein SPRG_14221 [Saprolegnia parasitica CBS 223.65]|uniref:Uncharacterized protein n=1 Tax=Saprolegnia parasitica (strain CBS 223.65) TaxID=695850 RepID=A0A067BP91_SAPPC|nr:hypothetical protein SPRG_14221 [Saprolegnia parasitica CBS 223.65]KDO20073.1 hypothetical protein SPRG_14221 [Saprolegnia parasitica CBS 223.65]|eukprot:XP_012209233.1 hypothetical protein SPRG_14221 [Saprolegnia parasitica CBS 223.65]
MTTTKRTSPEAATVLSLPHALTLIAQCLQSHLDASAFLLALPPASLNAPLAATKELLTRPGPLAYTWPSLNLDGATLSADNDIALYRAALPVFVSVHATEVWHFGRLFAADSTQAFIDFASQWPLKLTHVTSEWRYQVGRDVFCDLLRRCTRLQSTDLVDDEDDTDVFAAITTPNHHVHTICISEASSAAADLASHVLPWLGSGHARSLTIECTVVEDEEGLARALATTSSVRSLGIHDHQELLDAFLELELPLHQLTHVELRTYTPAAVAPFLALLDLTSLTSLAISSADDHADFFPLGRMPALRHLASTGGHIGDGFAEASTWPDLESMRFKAINFTPTAFATVLSYLGRAQGLRKMAFQQCKLADGWFTSTSRTLVRLINNGLAHAIFSEAGLDDTSLGHLAQTLREGRNTTPLTLDLSHNCKCFSKHSHSAPMCA